MKKDLLYIIEAHIEKPKKPENKFRKWDKKTPYYIHPLWCATMLMHETSIPAKIRKRGSLALLYHDIKEDTTAKLPEWLPNNVKTLIHELTVNSSEEEWTNLWKKDKEVRLLKLYDKVSNYIDGIWMKPERKEQHLAHLKKLCRDVKLNYGELNITKIAQAIIN